MDPMYFDGTVFVYTMDMTMEGEPVTLITSVFTRYGKRGKGYASHYMREVFLPLADEQGVTLVLSPDADGSIDSLEQKELVSWYERLGFEWQPEEYMRRLPCAAVSRSNNQKDLSSRNFRRLPDESHSFGIRRWHPDRYRSFESA